MFEAYIGVPGRSGTFGRNRAVFFSDTAETRIEKLLQDAPPPIKGHVTNIGNESSSNYWDGQIGRMSFTRTDGLGETTGYSYYDWSGDNTTFLNDKGTSGNDLTGVNMLYNDEVTFWKKNYTEQK